MRKLPDVRPTPEQLAIVSRNRPGTEIIRGAAGSGKTTTALLRLRSLIGTFVNRKQRQQIVGPVRILVLTYNRTLRGYIDALTRKQALESDDIKLEISTFGKWSSSVLGNPTLVNDYVRRNIIQRLGSELPLDGSFLLAEVDYALGRFLPSNIRDYVTTRRDGRGTSPRVDRSLREKIVEEVLLPYNAWKNKNNVQDWNDLAVELALKKLAVSYDVVITDETQDFSANQVRAIKNQLSETHSLTFVIDTTQRIYVSGFTWQEVGITVAPGSSRKLEQNYRNTVEIARFAAGLLKGLPVDDDGATPDFSKCDRHGPMPVVLRGKFSKQADFAINYIKKNVNLQEESVAFLHPLGGGWFDHLRKELERAKLDFVEITRQSEWPEGEENIAFSTLYSAKGLEFDHVMILGLNAEVMPHGDEEGDDTFAKLRRLLAMGIGRARERVILGYSPSDASKLIDCLDKKAYELKDV